MICDALFPISVPSGLVAYDDEDFRHTSPSPSINRHARNSWRDRAGSYMMPLTADRPQVYGGRGRKADVTHKWPANAGTDKPVNRVDTPPQAPPEVSDPLSAAPFFGVDSGSIGTTGGCRRCVLVRRCLGLEVCSPNSVVLRA